MTTSQTPGARAGRVRAPGDRVERPGSAFPGGPAAGGAEAAAAGPHAPAGASAPVPAGHTSGSAVGPGEGAAGPGTPQPPKVWPRCTCGHLRVVHDIAKNGTRTKCLTGLPPKGLPCGCTVYEPEVTR